MRHGETKKHERMRMIEVLNSKRLEGRILLQN